MGSLFNSFISWRLVHEAGRDEACDFVKRFSGYGSPRKNRAKRSGGLTMQAASVCTHPANVAERGRCRRD